MPHHSCPARCRPGRRTNRSPSWSAQLLNIVSPDAPPPPLHPPTICVAGRINPPPSPPAPPSPPSPPAPPFPPPPPPVGDLMCGAQLPGLLSENRAYYQPNYDATSSGACCAYCWSQSAPYFSYSSFDADRTYYFCYCIPDTSTATEQEPLGLKGGLTGTSEPCTAPVLSDPIAAAAALHPSASVAVPLPPCCSRLCVSSPLSSGTALSSGPARPRAAPSPATSGRSDVWRSATWPRLSKSRFLPA